MKRQIEWAILGGLVLFMSFTPGFAPVQTLLSTAVGRVMGLLGVVYVFMHVSPAIGLLLAIQFARCSRMPAWEGVDETLDEPTEMCECDPEFTYNSGTKMCEKVGAQSKKPAKCACIPGETWDDTDKKCIVKPVESAPPTAPPASGGAADLAMVQAQAAALPPSSVPETTGSAAGAAMASAPTSTPPPMTEKFSPMDSQMIRGKQYSPW
jgi:hypothetical protein